MERFRIAIIGLGLIGGSMAYALRGFRDAYIIGCDTNAAVRRDALKEKAVDEVCDNPKTAVSGADLVIFCVYPDGIASILEDCKTALQPGAVVTEVCGVKTDIARTVRRLLPRTVDYVGGHPMAGKEVEGFQNAAVELFWMTGFIITPDGDSKPESIALIHEMAHYIGATRITVATPEEHDKVIAYTSDLMHIAASGLCLSYPEKMNRAYTAGAFRDCTRIATINPELWTELFLANADNTISEIDRYLESLTQIRTAIAERNEERLQALLETVRRNKTVMQHKEPESGKESAL